MEARANETLGIDEQAEDRAFDRSLRPARFEDFVGQERIKDNLRVFVEAARRRGDPIDHTLFCGPPGLGKTTLALILAGERGVTLHSASGPAIEHKGQLAALQRHGGREPVHGRRGLPDRHRQR
jgi:Holliday junction DNA helicase RuvB